MSATLDYTSAFSDTQLPYAVRLIAARCTRLNIDTGELLRAALVDAVYDEAGRPTTELTEELVAAAETAAAAAKAARES